jgi:hypothetical protein
MKNYAIAILITLIVLVCIIIGSLETKKPAENFKVEDYPRVSRYGIQVIDSCEYIVSIYDRSRTVTHKGNCKFCQQRNGCNSNK